MNDTLPSGGRSAPSDETALPATGEAPDLRRRLHDVTVAVKAMRLVLDVSTQEAFKQRNHATVADILESWDATLLMLHCMAASLQGRAEALRKAYEADVGTD